MQIKHRKECEDLETEHREQFQNFMEVWDNALRSFQDLSQTQIETLRDKHNREMEELRAYLEQATPMQAKPSPEILNLQKILGHLSKQKK